MSNTLPLSIDIKLPLASFELKFKGELDARVTGLFGPSGSGKSSLVETIAGLRRGASGTIAFGDTVWQDSAQGVFVPPEQRGIGFVPQQGLLFPHLTVRQNLRFGAQRASLGSDLFEQVVQILGLTELLDRKPFGLSGGERQRVAAGRAVCSGPRLLIMDEPLSSLDAATRYQTLAFFMRLVSDLKLTMIWVSHDAVEVQAICDELIVLDGGNVKQRGNLIDVLTAPSVFSTFDFSGFQNVLHCQVVKSTATETIVMPAGGTMEITLTATGRAETLNSGDHALVTIPARSILVATENPSHVSAGNILQGNIIRIEPQTAEVILVHIQLIDQDHSTPLVVELTTAARDRLELQTAQSVYVLIKSTACMLQANNH